LSHRGGAARPGSDGGRTAAQRRLGDSRRGPDQTGDCLVGGEPGQVGQGEEGLRADHRGQVTPELSHPAGIGDPQRVVQRRKGLIDQAEPDAGAGGSQVGAGDGGRDQFLLLHGGGGPVTVTGFGELLAAERPARVISPYHPGFGGSPRPEALTTVGELAALYAELIDQLGLDDVTVVGNSIGGWIAAEMVLLKSPRISRIILVNAVGIEVPGHPVADFFSLTLDQVFQLG
jgi:pimeloyl-ACP methyl ester carboxylesterase